MSGGLENKPENDYESDLENVHEIDYSDLIKMYYYEAKEDQNPFYRKHLERVMQKLKGDLLVYLKLYLAHNKTDAPMETKEGALCSYFESFYKDLEGEDDPKRLAQRINNFIMYIHERLKLSLGEELIGFSARNLEALNYIDPDRPLEEQEEIIESKIKEEDEKYGSNK